MATKRSSLPMTTSCLDPDSYTKLLADRELLKAKGIKVGFLGARTNMSSLHMNIRNRLPDDQWNGMKWLSEEAMVQVQWIAPIFASVGIDGWPGFPPLELVQRQRGFLRHGTRRFQALLKPFVCPPCLLSNHWQRRGCRPKEPLGCRAVVKSQQARVA
jgi:hypothetical protein